MLNQVSAEDLREIFGIYDSEFKGITLLIYTGDSEQLVGVGHLFTNVV